MEWQSILEWERKDDTVTASRGDFSIVIVPDPPGYMSVLMYKGAAIAQGSTRRIGPDGLAAVKRSATKLAAYHGMELSDREQAVFGKLVRDPHADKKSKPITMRATMMQVKTPTLEVIKPEDVSSLEEEKKRYWEASAEQDDRLAPLDEEEP